MRDAAAERPEVERQEELSTEQRTAEDLSGLRDFEARRRAWVSAFIANRCDVTELPVSGGGGQTQGYGDTVAEVVATASHVVTGSVRRLRITGGSTTELSVDVDRVLKGSVPDPATVIQIGGPEMDPDPRYGTWLVNDAYLDLRPGDRVLLPLIDEGGELLVVPAAGIRFRNGRVAPGPFNFLRPRAAASVT